MGAALDVRNNSEAFTNFPSRATLRLVATLGERVEHALKARGLKPIDVDRAISALLDRPEKAHNGLTAKVIGKGRKPTADVLAAMAKVLGVTSGWLLDEEGSMDPQSGPLLTYDSLPGWAEAAEVEIRRDRVRAYVIRAAGRSPVIVRPREITPDTVYRVATFWLEQAPEEEREAAALADTLRNKG